MVLAPERFRGCCPFGASQVLGTPRTLPRRVDRRDQIYQQTTGSRPMTPGEARTVGVRSGQTARRTSSRELVARVLGHGVVLRPLAGQVRELALDLAPDAPDGDAEDALTA